MLNSIGSIVSSPYFYKPLAAAAIVGLSVKICKVAIPRIKNCALYLYDTNAVVSTRAFFCRKCSNLHRFHFQPNPTEPKKTE